MHYQDLFALIAIIAICGVVMLWVVYQAGRAQGYRHGLEKGGKLHVNAQHLKGMTDGYVMALQHTPGQRNEYMNNVLLKIGAITPEQMEADRKRRFALQRQD